MNIVSYADEHAAALRAGLDLAGQNARLLRVEPFLRHYYLSSPHRRLLLLLDGDGRVAATLGTEALVLRIGHTTCDAAVISNTYSLQAGAFPLLLMHWLKSVQVAMALPGTEVFRAQFARQTRWLSMTGLRKYWLNWGYPASADDAFWKRLAKPAARWARRVDASVFEARARTVGPPGLLVREVACVDEEMAQATGAFGLHIVADAARLNQRFDPRSALTPHRIFRVERDARTCGYVVLAEWPHCLLLSHCDGDDADALACAALMAIGRLNQGRHRYRKVILSSMHRLMQQRFVAFGFEPAPADTPFYMMSKLDQLVQPGPHQDWQINLDLGDTGAVLGLINAPA